MPIRRRNLLPDQNQGLPVPPCLGFLLRPQGVVVGDDEEIQALLIGNAGNGLNGKLPVGVGAVDVDDPGNFPIGRCNLRPGPAGGMRHPRRFKGKQRATGENDGEEKATGRRLLVYVQP